MKKIVPFSMILIGIYWCISSFNYGLWVRKGPGGGFLPLVAGLIAIVFATIVLMENWKVAKGESSFNIKALIPPLALVAIIFASKLVGMVIAIGIYIFVWLKYYEKQTLIQASLVAIICPATIYLIFVMWLKAPLPRGILGLL